MFQKCTSTNFKLLLKKLGKCSFMREAIEIPDNLSKFCSKSQVYIYELNVMYQEKKILGASEYQQSVLVLNCGGLECLKCHTENCHTETANKQEYLLKIGFLLQQLSPKSLQKMGLNWYDRKNFPPVSHLPGYSKRTVRRLEGNNRNIRVLNKQCNQ